MYRYLTGSGSGREVPAVPLFITNSAPGFATGGLGKYLPMYSLTRLLYLFFHQAAPSVPNRDVLGPFRNLTGFR